MIGFIVILSLVMLILVSVDPLSRHVLDTLIFELLNEVWIV